MESNLLTVNENIDGQLVLSSDGESLLAKEGNTLPGKPSDAEARTGIPESGDAACGHGPDDLSQRSAHGQAIPRTRSMKIMEAVLFAVPGPVEAGMLARACGIEKAEALRDIRKLKDILAAEESGIIIKETEAGFEACTNPEYFENLVRVVSAPKKPGLTDIMLETLAIVAEKAPVTRVEIEKIRGVKSDFAVNKLVEYGLIEEKGRLQAPGRPMLFGPTDEFSRRFGVDCDNPVPDVDGSEMERIRREAEEEAAAVTGAVPGES